MSQLSALDPSLYAQQHASMRRETFSSGSTQRSRPVGRKGESEGSYGIGGSIKRKLRDATANITRSRTFRSLSRSRSRSASRHSSSNDDDPSSSQQTRTRRSQSEVLASRPIVQHIRSEPAGSFTITIEHSPPPRPAFDLPARSDQQSAMSMPSPSLSSQIDDPLSESPAAKEPSSVDIIVPQLLQQGVPMLKVSAKKQKRYIFKLDPDQGRIVWESKKLKIIPIENIKELREGADARYYREQFQLAQEYEERWITIVYLLDGGYKTLHLIASTRDVFHMWDITLRKLYAVRQKLTSGLGNTEIRQAVWEKQFWRTTESDADQQLSFDEVERMCRRLNINPSREDLWRRFRQADSQNRGYLDFADFQRFVKSLKARPEIDRLYERITAGSRGPLTFGAFERFMQTTQKSTSSTTELQKLFLRYASAPSADPTASVPPSPEQNTLDLAVQSAATTDDLSSLVPRAPSSPGASVFGSGRNLSIETAVMTPKGFTTFLLSADNSAFTDQHGKIHHDMTRPLPDYFVSSSHNTYLVGHQLVGESTIEGYIRALLHSCRSVEIDIYDGDIEPMIYHGHTLTTKVSLRDTCAAISKYAFVASPYPIIISAEIHCSIPQQEMIVRIMREEFGDALVSAPVDGRPKIEVLPSPEELKGRVLLKAKNLYVSDKDGIREKDVIVDTESSSTETSSDLDLADEAKHEVRHEWRKARESEAEAIKDLKSEVKKARNTLGRVRSPHHGIPSASSMSPRSEPRELPSVYQSPKKVKMSLALVALLVYTVGVKCRGLNKKEVYASEHMFSLSENTANRILKQSMMDLIKHNRTHLVRIYPKGTRIGSTNFEPHRFWSAGAQLVAINWQTFDLGYMINHAMFQRNGRAGYVLKPLALRSADKQLLNKRTKHRLEVNIISAQQLPRPKELLGREVSDKSILDPYVEVSLHIPDWPQLSADGHTRRLSRSPLLSPVPSAGDTETTTATPARVVTYRTGIVRNNGFNPVWEQVLSLPFDLAGDMLDLVFVRFAVRQEGALDDEPLAVYCASLGSLNMGYRHLPLHDAQLSQYLFSTLFVKFDMHDL